MDKQFDDHDQPGENALADGAADQTQLTPEQEVKAQTEKEPGVIEKLQAQIADKDKEIAELKDQHLRLLAEGENARKRLRQQSEETVRLQRENLLRELLPVVDNLERAVDAASGGGNGKPIIEGVEMVLRSLLDFLKTHGVTQLDSVGQPFDPRRHEAVDQIESSQYPPNTIINELHRGYQIGDRLLRPARVAVAKSSAANGTEGDGGGSDSDDR
jgi:molecular chaperone GrpE